MKLARKNSLVIKSDFKKYRKKLRSYTANLQSIYKSKKFELDECSINCPYDNVSLNKTIKIAKKYNFAKSIILVGIGGSNLGTKTIYDYLGSKKSIIFLDTINLKELAKLKEYKLTSKNAVIILISKSGETTESIVNAEIILKKYPKLKKNTVVISNFDSKLTNLAKSKHLDFLEIYPKVGGRYSVFSPVGILPLLIAGVDISMLLKGAKQAVKDCTKISVNNKAINSAITIYVNLIGGKQINNYFLFDPNLETLGKWIRQLVAESLGKDNKGIMPIFTLGTVDLHSIYQLFLQGPKNVFTTFIKTENSENFKLDRKLFFNNLVADLESKKLSDIYNTVYTAVKNDYKKNKLPFLEIKFNKLDEYEFGYFMQYKMIETMYLGKLLNTNPFNQPGVEEYKSETRKLLKTI